nr:hypothetical protein [Alphaproteobacteria bacterium]
MINDHYEDTALVDEALSELSGQILLSVSAGPELNSCILKFDLEGWLHIWPSMDVDYVTEDDDQWGIFMKDRSSISYQMNGDITTEEAPTRPDGPFRTITR